MRTQRTITFAEIAVVTQHLYVGVLVFTGRDLTIRSARIVLSMFTGFASRNDVIKR